MTEKTIDALNYIYAKLQLTHEELIQLICEICFMEATTK
jgi:hypothetical protein